MLLPMDEGFDLPTEDELIASVAKFLIEGGEEDAASLILACEVVGIGVTWSNYWNNQTTYGVAVKLSGPRVAYDILSDGEHALTRQVTSAVSAVLEHGCSLDSLSIRAERVSLSPDRQAELLEMARGIAVHNQAANADKFRLWENLRFRSQSEIR